MGCVRRRAAESIHGCDRANLQPALGVTMTPEKETELFMKLDMLITAVGRMNGKLNHLAEDVAEISRRLPATLAYAPREKPAE